MLFGLMVGEAGNGQIKTADTPEATGTKGDSKVTSLGDGNLRFTRGRSSRMRLWRGGWGGDGHDEGRSLQLVEGHMEQIVGKPSKLVCHRETLHLPKAGCRPSWHNPSTVYNISFLMLLCHGPPRMKAPATSNFGNIRLSTSSKPTKTVPSRYSPSLPLLPKPWPSVLLSLLPCSTTISLLSLFTPQLRPPATRTGLWVLLRTKNMPTLDKKRE